MKNKKSNKNKKILKILLIVIAIIAIISIIVYRGEYIKKENEKIDYDYSQEDESEVFFDKDEGYSTPEETETIETMSEEEKKEIYSLSTTQYSYRIKRPELYGKEFKITLEEAVIEDGYRYCRCKVRITDSFITKCKIEAIYDDKNQVEFLDENKNPKDEFLNGESIIIKCPDKVDLTFLEYKVIVEFKNNDNNYKIAKTTSLDITDPRRGRIEATFYEPGTKNIFVGGKVRLDRIIVEQNNRIREIDIATPIKSSGKVIFTNVPVGRYKLTKIINGQDIESKEFYVSIATTTTVEF